MFELDSNNFRKEIKESEKLAVVDFWSPNCPNCLTIMPEIEALSEELKDKANFYKVNAAESRRMTIGERVLGLPSIVVYYRGVRKGSLSGVEVTIENIKKLIEENH